MSQLEPAKTSTEITTKTSETDDRSCDIDDKPRDQNPTVADGDEMSDSLPKDHDAGFQRPNWEKNREKRHYKNYQIVQQKQKKEQQLQKEHLQKRQQRHQGSAIDCDFVGGLVLKDVFLCKVNKFVDIEKVKSNLNKRNIPFENVTKESHKN